MLHGLGSADMKGGLAVMLQVAEGLGAGPADHEVTLVFYEGEEVADEHNGLRHLFAHDADLLAGDFAILLEPTSGWVEAGCQGTIHVRASFAGARAHSARPWMGVNAIHRAAPLLQRLAAFEAGTVSVEGLEYREALQVVKVGGGVANNVVPDACDIVVNRRFAPARPLEVAVAEVEALVAEADAVEVLNASMAAPPNLAHPLVDGVRGLRACAVCGPSSGGPTSLASPRGVFPRATSVPATPRSPTPQANTSTTGTSATVPRCSPHT